MAIAQYFKGTDHTYNSATYNHKHLFSIHAG